MMKFKFDKLEYQEKAINSVIDLFEGQPIKHSEFTIENGLNQQIGIFENVTEDGYNIGIGNKLDLTEEEIFKNLHNIQLRNGIKNTQIKDNNYYEFDIKMETGTGKTYVYLKSIFELNKKYGFSKFIIIVPSVAIKEGVKKSLDITLEQFKKDYPEIPYDKSSYFVYNSSKPEQVRSFAINSNISIMVITIDSFNKDKNIINQTDRETGRLLDLISATNPIIIIDEPQMVDNTEKAQESINNLKPIVSLRYSATHSRKSNLLYSFDSIDAYEGEFVKQIEVASFESENCDNKAYINVKSITSDKGTIKAKVEISVLDDRANIVKKSVDIYKFKKNNLFTLSKGREVYKGYIVKDIYCEENNKYIEFLNGEEIHEKQIIGDIDDLDFKRQQIRKTIEEHLDKEKLFKMRNLGIKVLSLFFIDEVKKYRDFDENGKSKKGIYAQIFEEEYNKLIKKTKYNDLFAGVDHTIDVKDVHNGYFAIDKKVLTPFEELETKKSKKDAEESTYNLIMRDKERLLSLDNKLRFIFSHSALGVGWDNPNVFQICTLAENRSEIDRRQKIGRGLRLCVNQNGERQQGFDINTLTVIANESYEKFAKELQREIEDNDNTIKFGIIETHVFACIPVKDKDGNLEYLGEKKSKEIFNFFIENGYIDHNGKVQDALKIAIKDDNIQVPEQLEEYKTQIQAIAKKFSGNLNIKDCSKKTLIETKKEVLLDQQFIDLWNQINQKTVYSIDFNSEELKENCIKAIKENVKAVETNIILRQGVRIKSRAGIEMLAQDSQIYDTIDDTHYYPDIVTFLQNKTNLTRKTIVDILIKSGTLTIFKQNPQSYMTQVAQIISRSLRDLIIDGIKYIPIDDYYAQKLLEENPLYGYLNKNMMEAPSNKYPYTHVVYDSENEAEFAKRFENSKHVLKYVKLPSKFKISTPLGPYNPDWAVLIDKDGEKKLYFVIETKRENPQALLNDDLRQNEKDKIYCGRKHFKSINKAKFEVVTNYDKFLQEVLK